MQTKFQFNKKLKLFFNILDRYIDRYWYNNNNYKNISLKIGTAWNINIMALKTA